MGGNKNRGKPNYGKTKIGEHQNRGKQNKGK